MTPRFRVARILWQQMMSFRTVAAFLGLALAGCAGTSTGLPSNAPGTTGATTEALPQTSTVLVTTRLNKRPISGVEVTLTHNSWPNGKLIAKGKTKLHGSVSLSGNWTGQQLICAGAKYASGSRTYEASVCEQPLSKRVILDFN